MLVVKKLADPAASPTLCDCHVVCSHISRIGHSIEGLDRLSLIIGKHLPI